MRVIIKNAEQLRKAKEDYEALRKAWRKTLLAQSYSESSNQLTRASLKEIRSEMADYEAAIDAYESHRCTGIRSVRAVPLD